MWMHHHPGLREPYHVEKLGGLAAKSTDCRSFEQAQVRANEADPEGKQIEQLLGERGRLERPRLHELAVVHSGSLLSPNLMLLVQRVAPVQKLEAICKPDSAMRVVAVLFLVLRRTGFVEGKPPRRFKGRSSSKSNSVAKISSVHMRCCHVCVFGSA